MKKTPLFQVQVQVQVHEHRAVHIDLVLAEGLVVAPVVPVRNDFVYPDSEEQSTPEEEDS